MRRELNALVGIEDQRLPVLQAQAQGVDTERPVERIGQLPGDDKAAEPVENGNQIHEAPRHRHLGDIRSPDLIGTVDGHAAQQIGIFLVLRMGLRGARTRRHGLQSQATH